MKISKVSCTQFAGIRNQEFTFTDGINLVYGKNESGKSTLANLIGYIYCFKIINLMEEQIKIL